MILNLIPEEIADAVNVDVDELDDVEADAVVGGRRHI